MPKPFSKLKKQIEALFVPELEMTVHCLSYPIRSQHGNSSIPRFYVKLGRDIIWDFPKDFPIKNVDYHYWNDDNNISDLIREYIDTPLHQLLGKKYPLEHVHITHSYLKDGAHYTQVNWDNENSPHTRNEKYDFNLDLINLFRVADRRISKYSLKKWASELNNPRVNTILECRLRLNENLKLKNQEICTKCQALNQMVLINLPDQNLAFLQCQKCGRALNLRTGEKIDLPLNFM